MTLQRNVITANSRIFVRINLDKPWPFPKLKRKVLIYETLLNSSSMLRDFALHNVEKDEFHELLLSARVESRN